MTFAPTVGPALHSLPSETGSLWPEVSPLRAVSKRCTGVILSPSLNIDAFLKPCIFDD